MLDAEQTPHDNELYYAKPEDYLKFCEEKMSKNVSKLVDSEFNEFTILVHRENSHKLRSAPS